MKEITYAYLETTNHCNLNCSFCNRSEVVKKATHIELSDWDIILKKLSSHPIKEAKLMGLGEPFLHPKYDEICKMFKETFPEAFVITATNCQYKVTDKFYNALKYIDLVYFSIDGYGDNYEKARDGASWSKLITFLDSIDMDRIDKTRITINFVVTDDTYLDIEKINDLVKNKYSFIEEVRLNIAQNWSENETNTFPIHDDMLGQLKKYKKNLKGKAPWTYSDCFWPKEGIYTTVKGEVKICCLNTSTKSIGNILTQNLDDIRSSEKLKKVKQDCSNNIANEHCKTCDYKKLSPVLGKVING